MASALSSYSDFPLLTDCDVGDEINPFLLELLLAMACYHTNVETVTKTVANLFLIKF